MNINNANILHSKENPNRLTLSPSQNKNTNAWRGQDQFTPMSSRYIEQRKSQMLEEEIMNKHKNYIYESKNQNSFLRNNDKDYKQI